MKKRVKKNGEVFEFAPGECKTPTNYLTETDFDICAFPTLHSDGKYGYHAKRPIPLTPHKYFSQRILNRNPQVIHLESRMMAK